MRILLGWILGGMLACIATPRGASPTPEKKPAKPDVIDHITVLPDKVVMGVGDSVRIVTQLWLENGKELKLRTLPLWYSCTPQTCGIALNPSKSEPFTATILGLAPGEFVAVIRTPTKKADSVFVTVVNR